MHPLMVILIMLNFTGSLAHPCFSWHCFRPKVDEHEERLEVSHGSVQNSPEAEAETETKMVEESLAEGANYASPSATQQANTAEHSSSTTESNEVSNSGVEEQDLENMATEQVADENVYNCDEKELDLLISETNSAKGNVLNEVVHQIMEECSKVINERISARKPNHSGKELKSAIINLNIFRHFLLVPENPINICGAVPLTYYALDDTNIYNNPTRWQRANRRAVYFENLKDKNAHERTIVDPDEAEKSKQEFCKRTCEQIDKDKLVSYNFNLGLRYAKVAYELYRDFGKEYKFSNTLGLYRICKITKRRKFPGAKKGSDSGEWQVIDLSEPSSSNNNHNKASGAVENNPVAKADHP